MQVGAGRLRRCNKHPVKLDYRKYEGAAAIGGKTYPIRHTLSSPAVVEENGAPMQPSGMHYFPVEWPFLLALFLLFSLLVVLIELRSLRYAYERMGIPSRYAMAILLVTLLGSSINIPLAEFPPEKVISGTVVHHHGMRYGVPVVRQWPGTVLAINVGGALIPILLSIYLALKNRILMVDAKDTLAHVLDLFSWSCFVRSVESNRIPCRIFSTNISSVISSNCLIVVTPAKCPIR
jgi:uncharacterized membrane protein